MSKVDYLNQNLITYIGNKRKLVKYIEDEIIHIKENLQKEQITSFDGFAGSGSVSRMLKFHSSILFVNDMEPYSHCINQCYLSNPNPEKQQKINQYIHELNHINFTHEDIICKEYSPNQTYDIKKHERAFYTRENALIIDSIRNKINDYPKEYFPFLIAPLLVKSSIHTNTSGVFKGFHKKDGIGHFGGKDEINTTSRITKQIILDQPIFSTHDHKCKVFHHNSDINELIDDLPLVDIAYLDPPYNQHPYGSNYFMLNTILTHKIEGNLSKVSGIPNQWTRSNYNYQSSALKSLKHLLQTINARYIILSYNNEGIISKDQLMQLFNELDLYFTLREIEYQTYRGSRNLKDRNNKVTEYLWILSPLFDISEPYDLTPLI
jgi:adenine-specific DNA-methyltransferase